MQLAVLALFVSSLRLIHLSQAGFVITSTPPKIEVGITEGVTLDCRYRGDPSSSIIHTISRIRILKESSPQNYVIVAEVRDVEPTLQNLGLDPTANLTGFMGDLTTSYISIYWTIVTSSILGNYRCDVVGYKSDLDISTDRSPVFTLKESNVTIQDVIDLTNKQKADLEEQLRNQKLYCDNRIAIIEAEIDSKINIIKIEQENASKEFEEHLFARLAGLTADVKRLMDTGVLQYWPEGSYALPRPDSDCPFNVGAVWEAGARKFHTESSDRNLDSVSQSIHLLGPILGRVGINNFVSLSFCVSVSRSPGAQWPKGAYCINRVNGACPGGFNSGGITWQDELSDSQADVSGRVPDGNYARNLTTIYFCCRNDAPHGDAIYLPRSKPFFLYRYNGTCQSVVGMQAQEEFVLFDTDNSNTDSFENSFHPDGSINNVQLQLCYYKEV